MDFTQLRTVFNIAEISEILDVTIKQSKEIFETLDSAIKDHNYNKIYECCHNIIGMGFIGSHKLFDISTEINNILRDKINKNDNHNVVLNASDTLLIERLLQKLIMYEDDFIKQIKAELLAMILTKI